MSPIRAYLDVSTLIAAANGTEAVSKEAALVLLDSNRIFVSSHFLITTLF